MQAIVVFSPVPVRNTSKADTPLKKPMPASTEFAHFFDGLTFAGMPYVEGDDHDHRFGSFR